ncbi:MAG: hypothetical protein ACTSQB_02715 [Candidatus Heimdallarchaeota archaeon]
MNSHHTYIPWFHHRLDPNDGKSEAVEQMKTMRLCFQCKAFKQFISKDKDALWLFLSCPDCDETIKIPRDRNHAANKWDKEKWK